MERPDAWLLTDRVVHQAGKGDPFAAAVRASRMPMIITDPRQVDNPIVFANDAFLTFTGYDRSEVIGRNCRFLQGAETDQTAVSRVTQAIANQRDVSVDLLNYRKDGSSFWNALYISPVSDDTGTVQYHFASQLDITDRIEILAAKTALLHEVDHRVKNNLQMVSALIAMQANTIDDIKVRRALDTMLGRIEALSAVHRRLYQSDDITRVSVADFVHDIVTELVGVTGRNDIEVRLDLDPVDISAECAAPLALVVNEIVTNALKHALPSDRSGVVAVRVKQGGERFRIEIEDDGVGMPIEPRASSSSLGKDIVRLLSRQIRADVKWVAVEPSGTRVIVDLAMR